jgi:hypothetical protein
MCVFGEKEGIALPPGGLAVTPLWYLCLYDGVQVLAGFKIQTMPGEISPLFSEVTSLISP